MKIQEKINKKTFVIALHESLPGGPGHDLREYLLINNVKEIVFITHPLLNLKEFNINRSRIKTYTKKMFIETQAKFHLILPMPLLYTKDLIYTLMWIIRRRKTYDVYIGLDPLNAFAGIILKKLQKVNKVVYYTIDYVPK